MSWARRHPYAVDGLLAAVIVLLIGHFGANRHTVASYVIAVVMGAALIVRRRWPIGAFAVIAVAGALQFVLDVPAQAFDIALVVALYTVASNRGRRDALVALAVVEIGALSAGIWWSSEPGRAVFGPAVLAVAAVLLGNSMRLRRAYLSELEERAARHETPPPTMAPPK